MKPERWRQIYQLLEAALEREPEERAAFLAVACAGNESLRLEVESLLQQEAAVAISFCSLRWLSAASPFNAGSRSRQP